MYPRQFHPSPIASLSTQRDDATMETTSSHTIRVLLVSDDEFLRLGLRSLFERTPGFELTAEAGNRSEALLQAAKAKPTVALLDGSFSDSHALDLCRELARRRPPLPVLILANGREDLLALRAMQVGAQGCMPRRVTAAELLQAIKTVAGGRTLFDEHVTSNRRTHVQQAGEDLQSNLERLSPQERRLFPLVAEGMTNREIAGVLGLSEKTIKNYLTSLYIKLGISRRAEAVRLYTLSFQTPSAVLLTQDACLSPHGPTDASDPPSGGYALTLARSSGGRA